MSTAMEELLAKIKPTTASVRVCLRGDLMGEMDIIDDDLTDIGDWKPTGMEADPRAGLLARKDELKTVMHAESRVFKFQGVGDQAWSDLRAAHPPREGKEDAEDFNPVTFPVPLVAAASLDPKMSEAQVASLFAALTLTQRRQLFNTAYAACTRGVDVGFIRPSSDEAAPTAKK